MLYACLTRLSMAATDDVSVIVSIDRGGKRECAQVAESFSERFAHIYLRQVEHHNFHGNSRNVISGIKDALLFDGDLVHVVEDDVMVALSYFHFHEAMHATVPGAFAVSACRNQNLEGPAPGSAYCHPSYQSLGVSFRPDVVRRIAVHDTPSFYSDMVGYCRRKFPKSAIPAGHAEQDGLINRIREGANGVTVYTSRPRAFHAGFHGYNRLGRRLNGSIERRAERILSMTSEEMNAMAETIKDHEVIDLGEDLSTELEEGTLNGLHRAQI